MARRVEPQVGLGLAIRQLREGAGLSQEEVAHRADLHPTWISKLESGRANPALGTVVRVAEALGVKASELLGEAERIDANR